MDYRRRPFRVQYKRVAAYTLLAAILVWLMLSKLLPNRLSSSKHIDISTYKYLNYSRQTKTSLLTAPPEDKTGPMARLAPDTFADYKFRNHTACQISSLDLNLPYLTFCQNRNEFLQAFSGGGRIGFDSPYFPQGCDMRWFSTEEVCQILSRYEKVIVVGDSMMRHVVGAMNVLLRKDLGYGAVTNWNFNEEELRDCFCNHQMDVKSCSVQGIFSTSSVLEHDPSSLACPSSQPVDLVIEMMLKFPLDPEELARFRNLLSPRKPHKPYAFIFGHGLWNDLDLKASMHWLDGILEETIKQAPYYQSSTIKGHKPPFWPRLFVTPNSAGVQKPDNWLVSQGDKALMVFEKSVSVEAGRRGVETMGTWNMSIQATKYDGVHLDLKGNLIKAMGVLNWLDMLDVDTW
ncbi:hypothetical protein RBB50_001590 [Rhinocladiella similis]